MPNNQQRREAAKRKLERQLGRRIQREKQRRQRLLIVGAAAAVIIVAVVAVLIAKSPAGNSGNSASGTLSSGAGTSGAAASSGADTAESSAAESSAAAPGPIPCTYTKSGTAAKTVNPPTNLDPPYKGTVDATISLNGQAVAVTLDRATAPCTVNSFLSLASQKYFDNTPCHRLTSSAALSVLQCGDPTGKGTGGPGYTFKDELSGSETYKAGTLAMANSGPDTNGSQFFMVYKDSSLPASYTVFGKISAAGLKVLDAIAAKGVKGGAEDGAPAEAVNITAVAVPAAAVSTTVPVPTPTPTPTPTASASGAVSSSEAAGSVTTSGSGSTSAAGAATTAGSSAAAGSTSASQ